jgi:hypothetical protein
VGALVEPEPSALVGAGLASRRVAVDDHDPLPGPGRGGPCAQPGQPGPGNDDVNGSIHAQSTPERGRA